MDSMSGLSGKGDEIWPDSERNYRYGVVVTILSTCFFWLAGKISDKSIPNAATQRNYAWRWKNITVSLLHSAFTGVWAILCFYWLPDMSVDVISVYSPAAYNLIAFSYGYFIYDFYDMVSYKRSRQSIELMGHHAVVLVCFGICLVTHLYIAYAVSSLFTEVNSIFLHIRQLMQSCGFKKTDTVYRLNSLVTLATFLTLRLGTLSWMTHWLVLHKDRIPLLFYTVGCSGMAIMTVMNIILFYRILKSDFLTKKDSIALKDAD